MCGGEAAAGEVDVRYLGAGERPEWDVGRDRVSEVGKFRATGVFSELDGPGGVGYCIGELCSFDEVFCCEGVVALPAVGFADAGLGGQVRALGVFVFREMFLEEACQGFGECPAGFC